MGYGSRKEIKKLAKKGLIQVDGETVRDCSARVDCERQQIAFDGQVVVYREHVYVMLNKPQGVISATEDVVETTVLDLLHEKYRRFKVFPVGRLDKDTEGLLLITNDGKLARHLLSPRKKTPKTYYAEIEGVITEEDVCRFREGVTLNDGYRTMPSELNIIESNSRSKVELTIYEGKFHQVKRMFRAVGKRVVFLKRMKMGPLHLDSSLAAGEYRELTSEELASLKRLA